LFKHIQKVSPYEPTILGKIKVKNRFIRPAMGDYGNTIGIVDEF
jgi:hypothetical protein